MKIKKIFSLILVLFLVCTMVGCGKSDSESIWNEYVDAVNAKDIEKIASLLVPETKTLFLEENSDYLDGINSLETVSYDEYLNCDFSDDKNIQTYYAAKVQVKLNGSVIDLDVYSFVSNGGGYIGKFLCNPINLTDDSTEYGNKPNKIWLDKAYYLTDDYTYGYDIDSKGNILNTKLINFDSNLKKVVLPEDINGIKLTSILPYSFYRFGKVLCFTIATSKLQEIELPNTIKTIGDYAFYQCTKLKTVSIPQSVTNIGGKAFCGCSKLETITLNTKTTGVASELVESTSLDPSFVIENAQDLQIGEYLDLNIKELDNTDYINENVIWKSSAPKIISVDIDTGEIVANAKGTAVITATMITDSTKTVSVQLKVTKVESVPFQKGALIEITNARNLVAGEILNLDIKDVGEIMNGEVKWSIVENNKSAVATIDPDTGELKALSEGSFTVRVALKSNAGYYAEVPISVAKISPSITIAGDAFDRCPNLKELYIYATNPNTISIKDLTHFNLSSEVKIYVPKGTKGLYAINSYWELYSTQIYEME